MLFFGVFASAVHEVQIVERDFHYRCLSPGSEWNGWNEYVVPLSNVILFDYSVLDNFHSVFNLLLSGTTHMFQPLHVTDNINGSYCPDYVDFTLRYCPAWTAQKDTEMQVLQLKLTRNYAVLKKNGNSCSGTVQEWMLGGKEGKYILLETKLFFFFFSFLLIFTSRNNWCFFLISY